jgi:hypothetical protein
MMTSHPAIETSRELTGDPENRDDSTHSRDERHEQWLDEALMGSFPASDPRAIGGVT